MLWIWQPIWIILWQSLSCDGFEFVEVLLMITLKFIMKYIIESNISYTLMVDVDYTLYLKPLHMDFHCYLKTM